MAKILQLSCQPSNDTTAGRIDGVVAQGQPVSRDPAKPAWGLSMVRWPSPTARVAPGHPL